VARRSAGLIVWRRTGPAPEFLLAHHGGPLWAKRDLGAWTIPKGLIDPGEDPLAAAKREFAEETGLQVDGAFVALSPCKQPGGKVIQAWAVESDLDLQGFVSGEFTLEWPPRSGRLQAFPEVDRIAYFDFATAAGKLLAGQRPILDEALSLAARRDRDSRA